MFISKALSCPCLRFSSPCDDLCSAVSALSMCMRILRPSAASLNNPDEPNIVLGVHSGRMSFDRSTGVIRTTHDIRRTIQNLFFLPMYTASESCVQGTCRMESLRTPPPTGCLLPKRSLVSSSRADKGLHNGFRPGRWPAAVTNSFCWTSRWLMLCHGNPGGQASRASEKFF